MNKKDRQKVFDKFGGKCAYCGCELPVKGWHVDHIKPVERLYEDVKIEGTWKWKRVYKGMRYPENDCIDNCLPTCAKCNINKHGESIEGFRKSIEKYLNSLNERIVQYQMVKKYGLVQETNLPVVFYFETINQQTEGK